MKTAGRRKTFLAWGIVALMASACATTRPANQSFVSLRTPNFEILSALGRSQTRALARDLELFHAGVLAIAGLEETPDWREPTRVLAFDDRSLGRPFGIRGRTAYFVPGVDRGTLVFRVPGGWHERASRELRADYAQRLIRGRSPRRLPLWVRRAWHRSPAGFESGMDRFCSAPRSSSTSPRCWTGDAAALGRCCRRATSPLPQRRSWSASRPSRGRSCIP